MWTLILTLLYAGEAARLDHLDGFVNVDACTTAGQIWQQSVSGNVMAHAHFACVHR